MNLMILFELKPHHYYYAWFLKRLGECINNCIFFAVDTKKELGSG